MMPQSPPYLPVLQLNADYTPNKVLRWERAVELLMMGKAVTCTPYPGRFVRSPSLAIPWPAVGFVACAASPIITAPSTW